MRSLLVLLLVCLCSSLVLCSVSWATSERWQEWKLQHGKNFGPAADGRRRATWTQNLQVIVNHNKNFLLGLSRFIMAVNKFAAMANFEYSGILGARVRQSLGPVKVPELPQAPRSLDYRTQGYVTVVKDQGLCGSSWAFAVTGAVEGQVFKTTGVLMPLSEQDLLDCSKVNVTYGCDGAWMGNAYNYIQTFGINGEVSYRYLARDDQPCLHDPERNVIFIDGYARLPPADEETLKKALASVGPITVAVDATNWSFMLYKTDFHEYLGLLLGTKGRPSRSSSYLYQLTLVYPQDVLSFTESIYDEPMCDASEANHAMLLVGYGSENGADYWILKNSWGPGWGEKGYMRMLRGSNLCGVASYALYPLM